MAKIKTTGAEFKCFYQDPVIWTDESYNDDIDITVDGADGYDLDLLTIDDSAVVVLSGGCYIQSEKAEPQELCSVFKRWQNKRNKKTVVAVCDKSVHSQLVELIKNSGLKVKIL